jgi:hypothetical protein
MFISSEHFLNRINRCGFIVYKTIICTRDEVFHSITEAIKVYLMRPPLFNQHLGLKKRRRKENQIQSICFPTNLRENVSASKHETLLCHNIYQLSCLLVLKLYK